MLITVYSTQNLRNATNAGQSTNMLNRTNQRSKSTEIQDRMPQAEIDGKVWVQKKPSPQSEQHDYSNDRKQVMLSSERHDREIWPAKSESHNRNKRQIINYIPKTIGPKHPNIA